LNFLLIFFFPIPDSQECFRCPKHFRSNEARNACDPLLEEFLAFSDPLGLTTLAFAVFGSVLSILVILLLYMNDSFERETMVLLIAIIACFASSVPFLGRPTRSACQVQEPFVCICLTTAVVAVLQIANRPISVFQGTTSTFKLNRKLSLIRHLLSMSSKQ